MKGLFINKNVLWVCLTMMIYYFIMELYYLYFIGVSYTQFGFLIDINPQKYIETKILFVLILTQSIFISKVSEFIYSVFIFFFIFFLVPGLITYSFSDQIPGPLYSIIALQIALGTISVLKIRIPSIQSLAISYGLIMFLVILMLVPIIYNFGIYLNFSNFLLEDIAKTRSYYTENTATAINYLYSWLVKAIVPLFMVFFLIHKRYGYALISFLVLLYLYFISGNKIVYITTFVMLFFLFAGKDYFEKIKYFSIILIVGLLILPVMDFYILDSHSLKGLFVMRMLFLPSQLNYYYFDFFNGNPLYFAESNFFKLFVTYPYERPIGFIISKIYFNYSDMNANNGIISDGYMNLGYWGIVLNIIIVSGIFLFFNSTYPDSNYLGIFFVMVFLFLSAPMLSMIITSGLWIICLLALTIMKRKENIPS